jgi:hypothetical protein
MVVPNQRENIVTEYAFFFKHSHFDKFSHPKKWCWRPSKYTGNFSNCFIVLYKHLWTLKLKRQISHAYMWSLVSQFFYIFMSFESWSLDQCFLLFHFLILKFGKIGRSLYPNLQLVWKSKSYTTWICFNIKVIVFLLSLPW